MSGGSASPPGVQASVGTSAQVGASPAAARSTSRDSLTPTLPPDIPPRPTTHMAVNEFSWQMFVAMNWPAAPDQRGAPDPTKTIGQDGPTVWLTYKTPEEVFVAPGSTPAEWNAPPDLPPGCASAGTFKHPLVMNSKASEPLKSVQQAVGGTLTDQHGKLARYEIHLNKTSFDHIVANKLYDYPTQNGATSVNFPPGVLEVKAAWREMTAQDDENTRKRFYRTTACICEQVTKDGSRAEQCHPDREVGLVALHIVQKTPSSPQWIWATFEQVDNVKSSAIRPSFNDPTCPPDKCIPNKSTEKDGKPTTTPTQVTRVAPIPAEVQTLNAQWQAKLAGAVAGSPWQYYELIDTQWPTNPGDPTSPLGDPQPNIVANTILETYRQSDSSCQGCHSTATTVNTKVKSDFSFLFLHTRKPSATRGRK